MPQQHRDAAATSGCRRNTFPRIDLSGVTGVEWCHGVGSQDSGGIMGREKPFRSIRHVIATHSSKDSSRGEVQWTRAEGRGDRLGERHLITTTAAMGKGLAPSRAVTIRLVKSATLRGTSRHRLRIRRRAVE